MCLSDATLSNDTHNANSRNVSILITGKVPMFKNFFQDELLLVITNNNSKLNCPLRWCHKVGRTTGSYLVSREFEHHHNLPCILKQETLL